MDENEFEAPLDGIIDRLGTEAEAAAALCAELLVGVVEGHQPSRDLIARWAAPKASQVLWERRSNRHFAAIFQQLLQDEKERHDG